CRTFQIKRRPDSWFLT
ncbi:hypothetical protein D910_07949, partial [Dendroctonus ponderosae]